MILFLFVPITLAAVLWSLAPVLHGAPVAALATSPSDERNENATRRRQQMMDLEADHELGKVDEAEFKEMREGLIREEQSR